MALSTYALISLDELKEHVGAAGNAKDSTFESIINRVSDEIEDFLGRQIVSRSTLSAPLDPLTYLTEYHTFRARDGSAVYTEELYTIESPIVSVISIHEDSATPRTYPSTSLLVEGTDYEVVKPKGLIRRISGAGTPSSWYPDKRSVRVIYTAGYASTATVPMRIKTQALRYAALIWDEQKRGAFGISGASDALGNYTRFAPATFNADMEKALSDERRHWHWESGERAS